MNSPIIRSMPGMEAGRSDTVLPKTTSDRPVMIESSIAHATWIEVFAVTPWARPRPAIASVVAMSRSSAVSSTSAVASRSAAPVSRVGLSMPARVSCHARVVAS